MILDKQFVVEYLLKQKNVTSDETGDDLALISLPVEDDEDSIIFGNEKTATSELKKIAKLNQPISSAHNRNNCKNSHSIIA